MAQLALFLEAPTPAPLVVAYGAGVDSTAVLVEFARLDIRPDLILFADTGGEKPETIEHLHRMSVWLRFRGFPEVTTVRRTPTNGKNGWYATLEEQCIKNKMLPSLAYGGLKGCSLKWKREPQDAYCNNWEPAKRAWRAGLKVRKVIGYDAGAKDSRRAWQMTDDAKYSYWYPLREWGWDRARCESEIAKAGLPVPLKSACFFCPATQPEELIELHAKHPDMVRRIEAMEENAAPQLKTIQGLWTNGTKGTKGGRPRPGRMSEFIRALEASQIDVNGFPTKRNELPWDKRPKAAS